MYAFPPQGLHSKSYQGRNYTCIARGVLFSLPGGIHQSAAGFLSASGISACSFRRPEFLVDPPGVEPAHPQHRFCLPIGCGGFPPSVYTHLISELSAYCVGLRQARAFTSPKFFWLHLHSLLIGCAPIYFNVPGALKAGMPPTSHCCATSIRRFQRCLRTAYFLSSGTRLAGAVPLQISQIWKILHPPLQN